MTKPETRTRNYSITKGFLVCGFWFGNCGRRPNQKLETRNQKLFYYHHRLTRLKVPGVEHDRIAGFKPCKDLRPIRCAAAESNWFLDCFTVLDQNHFVDPGERHYGAHWHTQSRAVVCGYDLGARVGARAKLAVVMYLGLDDKHTILRRDGRTYPRDLAEVDIRITLERHPHLLPDAHVTRFAFRNFSAKSQRVHPDYVYERRAGCEIFADARAFLLHNAVERRVDRGVQKLLPRDLKLGTPLSHKRLAVANLLDGVLVAAEPDFVFGFSGIKLSFGQDAPLKQILGALEF